MSPKAAAVTPLTLRAAMQDVYEASTQEGPKLLNRWYQWATRVDWRPSKNWLKPSVSTGPELLVTSSVASLKAPSKP
jgi:hypothetical protein